MKNIMLVFSLLGIFVQEGILAQQYTTQELQLCSNESVVIGDAFVEQNNFTASADSRQLVLDTTCYPHSTIVQIIPDNPYFGICSGVLVSYNAVLTSGNCVYNGFFNDTLESATVYPARNGQYLPFDAIKSEEVYVHPSFMFPEINDNFDIGVLILESSFENNLNWMISDEVNTTMPFGIQDIIIQGYAGDIGNNVQFRYILGALNLITGLYKELPRNNYQNY
eukprot:TRINITY_DN3231_c0_g2_i1.p1 TRINITY_DN3231_c0_g2~~TRINITY_DN3231_c0_g2_i1.p1  ORF type:complete len:223 (-),score=10.61 TRINITY_DN3231_c0_g2_i1:514-1182(-)